MNVLIIEDEVKAARELKVLVEKIDLDIKVCAIIQSVEEAVFWLEHHEMPHLIISDIQLADGLCFEIFDLVKISAPVIFCTAYDEYALKAFENNGIDYLLKPVENDKLIASFRKIEEMNRQFSSGEYKRRLHNMIESFTRYKEVLYVNLGNRLVPLRVCEINILYTYKDSVFIYSNNRQYEIRSSLEQLQTDLDPRFFYRANRQFIINKNIVREINHIGARKLEIKITPNPLEKIIVSKAKSADFIRWFTSN